MIEIDKNPFIQRIRRVVGDPFQVSRAELKVLEMEAVAMVERNACLSIENEKLKTYADINWLRRDLDALAERVAKLEGVE